MIKRCGLFALMLVFSATVSAQTSRELKPLNNFSVQLYNELKKEYQNVFFSPLTCYSSLAILSDGAAGANKVQIDSVLGLSKRVQLEKVREAIDAMAGRQVIDGNIQLTNGCWIDRSIKLKKEFLKSYSKEENSKVEIVDMQKPAEVVANVNAWANDATGGTIPELLSANSIGPATKMLLCNSLYLDLPWESKFKPKPWYKRVFTDVNGEQDTLQYMFKMGYMEYVYDKKFHLVVRNLGQGEQAVYVVVPKEGYTLADIEEEITAKKLSQLTKQMYSQRVRLSIPKFSMEGEFDFEQPLKNMGVTEMFKPDANFSEMTDENLMVEAIHQKVKVDVNEKRIVAAAVTVVRSGLGSAVGMPNPDEPIDVIADRPFMFFIVDKPTNGIFFMGRYTVPNESDIAKEDEADE